MHISNFIDIGFSKTGDIEYIESIEGNNMGYVQGVEAVKQALYMRLKTELTGCALWKDMGQDLKSMYGKRMTKKNTEKVKNLLIKALTFGDLFDIINVDVIPLQDSILMLAVKIQIGLVKYSFVCDFDFQDSLLSELRFEII